jgi:hypothetical protein
MRRTVLALAACALSLGLTAQTASAGHVSYHGGGAVAVNRYHATAFAGGYYYAGRNHHHWAYRTWDARYGRYHYWDANLRCWYYWNAGRNCYYPITYCP